MNVIHVDGQNKGNIFLFTLSTCIWCRRTKQLLQDLNIAFDYIELDLLEGDDKEAMINKLQQWNPDRSFPTMVIDEQRSIIGYQEEEIVEVFGG